MMRDLEKAKGINTLTSRLEAILTPEVNRLGYGLLDLEYMPKSPTGPTLRIFIEHLENPLEKHIGLDDCMAVDRGLEPIMASPEFESVLANTFTLEVSSPGVDRPLRRPSDFEKFAGSKAVVKTYCSLTAGDLENDKYFEHHQKQKNFSGILRGLAGEKITMEIDGLEVKIPLALVSKAHLDVASEISLDK